MELLLWIIAGILILLKINWLIRKGRKEPFVDNLQNIKIDGVTYYHGHLCNKGEIDKMTGKTAIFDYLDDLEKPL